MNVLNLISFLVITCPSHISHVLKLTKTIKEFKPHARMHHVVIVVIIVTLTLYSSITSHATLILLYYATMLTLHSSFAPLYHVHFGCCNRDIMELRVYQIPLCTCVNRIDAKITFFMLLGIVCIPPTVDVMSYVNLSFFLRATSTYDIPSKPTISVTSHSLLIYLPNWKVD